MSAHYYEARRTNDGSIIGVVYHREHTRKQLSVGGSFVVRSIEVIDYETASSWNPEWSKFAEKEIIKDLEQWCRDNSIQAVRGVPLSEQNKGGEE